MYTCVFSVAISLRKLAAKNRMCFLRRSHWLEDLHAVYLAGEPGVEDVVGGAV